MQCTAMQHSVVYLLKHANHVAAIVLNHPVGDHLKTAVHDRSVEQVIPHKVHVVRLGQLLTGCACHQLRPHLCSPLKTCL